jgi:hypothetical protein
MTRIKIFLFALFAGLPFMHFALAAQEPAAGKEQLIYRIVVEGAGSKSQSWHGTIYGENGQAVKVPAGKTVMTDIGELVSTAATAPWKPRGMVPATPGMENIILPDAWTYELYGKDLGSRCPAWRGGLLRNRTVVKPDTTKQVQTSMGTFIWLSDSHGWVHKSWKVEVERCGIGRQPIKIADGEASSPKSEIKSANACVQVCQATNRRDVNACNYPKRTVEETRECLATVRWNFDACMQACGK